MYARPPAAAADGDFSPRPGGTTGGSNGRRSASSGRSGRTGSSSKLSPATTESVTGSGEGHAHGQ